MNKALKHYTRLANIFDYPDEDFLLNIREINEFFSECYPLAAREFESFADHMLDVDQLGQQELFIRSFDVQSLTTLDIGYILFGDDYKRGELLVNLNREHNNVNNECGTELADYLPNVLRLIPKIRDSIFLAEFIEKILVPALSYMIMAFEKNRVDEKEKFYAKKYKTIIDRPIENYTIYQQALKALFLVLSKDFDFNMPEISDKSSDFLKNIVEEITLEDK
jgi:nitrate reductase assembly molybdenum cofactor insertion protein NarJ